MPRLICLFLLMGSPLWAQDVKSFLSPAGAPVEASAEFIRLKDGKILLDYQAEKVLTPASVTKLVTAGAVLHYFTPAKVFETKVYYTGSKKRGIISGDLILVGDGDPFLVSERLWQLAADFRQMGLSQIRGAVIIDNSLFDDEAMDSSRTHALKRSSNAYNAPVSALGINFNTVAVSVFPSESIGAAPLVTVDPYLLDHVKIQNQAKTKKGTISGKIGVERVNSLGDDVRMEVRGDIGADSGLAKIYRSVADPVNLAGNYLKTFLRHEGIQVLGGIKSGLLGRDAKLLYTMTSYPMQRLVEGLNKFSNNYIADVLTKRLGAEFPKGAAPLSKGSGSFENGVKVLNRFLAEEVGVKSDYVIRNGSGLDTENLLSSSQLTKLLVHMASRLDIFPEFLASLPAAGWDGTLKKRIKSQKEMSGFIRAKTGTLSEPVTVVSLAGYVQHPTHGLCAFSIIQNGKQKAEQPGIADLQRLQDELLAYFIAKL